MWPLLAKGVPTRCYDIDIPATHRHRRHPVLTYLLMRHSFSPYLPNPPREFIAPKGPRGPRP